MDQHDHAVMQAEVARWAADRAAGVEEGQRRFARAEQRQRVRAYLEGAAQSTRAQARLAMSRARWRGAARRYAVALRQSERGRGCRS